ncbi:G-type lectin S-receptor-like serine/threonine-protein kinase, partial [Mucuna pruriens]
MDIMLETWTNTTESQKVLICMLMMYTTLFYFMPTFSNQDIVTITPNQSIQYHDILISTAGTFEAGLFDFRNSRLQQLLKQCSSSVIREVQSVLYGQMKHSWETMSTRPVDQCEYYAPCGVNSNYNINGFPICECLKGFIPKFQAKWDSYNWSGGCVNRIKLNCDNGDGFLKYTGTKLLDKSSSWFNKSLSLEECETLCLRNCSCTAYANLDNRGAGTSCLLWFHNIVDLGTHTDQGQEIYMRLAFSELETQWRAQRCSCSC